MRTFSSWTLAQRAALMCGLLFAFLGVGGLIVNPDFATGLDATAVNWLLIDWNGWHAVDTIVLAVAMIAGSFSPRLAFVVVFLVAVTDLGVGIWASLEERIAGTLYLPTSGDAIFHFLIAAVLFAVAAVQWRRDRASFMNRRRDLQHQPE